MYSLFRKMRLLKEAGKIHPGLSIRIRILFVLSIVMGSIVGYNVLFREVNPFIACIWITVGFAAGLFVFTRMRVVDWNEEKEVVQTGRMDIIGLSLIALYIVFEIVLDSFIKDYYAVSASVYIFSVIFGMSAGRAAGTAIEIDRVYRANFKSK